jgi:serine/threonine-protein kinase
MTSPPLSRRLQAHLGSDYEVMGELGHGGFAVVYLVGDRKRRGYLAVKVMREELVGSSHLLERFRREIGYASRLNHPNIVPVEFSAEQEDLFYYAMPRARGKPLNKHLRIRGKLALDETLNILRQVADALSHAHQHGVIHRDIKPSNIMVDSRGRVQVLDFGVARALSRDGGTLTISGCLVGSPEYMSPEQAANRRDIDHRADIYSWAVVGYEMLTGRPPFTGISVQQVLHQHMTASPARVQELRPSTPNAVAGVIERCLEKDRERRWGSVAEAAGELEGR